MSWKIKNPFPSKKRAFSTLATGYLFSLMFLSLGFLWLSEFKQHGYYHDGRAGINFYGDSALVTIIGVISISAALLLYTVYWSICVCILLKRKMFDNLKEIPEYVICAECLKPFYGKEAPSMKCPICGNLVEELKGFYDRHPELRKG